MHEATQTLDDSLAGILEDARRLGERGWTVPANQLPKFTPIAVRSVPPEHTDGLFVQIYSRNNAAEFETIAGELLRKPGLERWQPLIQQCIGAYQRGEHLLVVPCLRAACEGALASIVDRPHAPRPRALASQELAEAEGNSERFPWVSIDAFTNTIFMSATFAGERPRPFGALLLLDQARLISDPAREPLAGQGVTRWHCCSRSGKVAD